MKLRQVEWCHACERHVDFVFEDVVGRQVIVCPNCRHQHFREIDEGVITQVMLQRVTPGMLVHVLDPDEDVMASWRSDPLAEIKKVMVMHAPVIGIHKGHAVVPKDSKVKGQSVMVVTDRRWGVDPSQRGF